MRSTGYPAIFNIAVQNSKNQNQPGRPMEGGRAMWPSATQDKALHHSHPEFADRPSIQERWKADDYDSPNIALASLKRRAALLK